jgi:hypothetical protein
LIGSCSHLAGIIEDRLVLRGDADLLKCGNRHGRQQADDDDNDHDFNEGKSSARAGTGNVFHINNGELTSDILRPPGCHHEIKRW